MARRPLSQIAAALAIAALAPAAVAAETRGAWEGPPPAKAAAQPAPPAQPAAPPEAPPRRGEPPTAPKALPRGAVLEEVAGTVRSVDLRAHRLAVDTASGPVTLSLDRNTMVYTASGLGTVLDVSNGSVVRAGRNADFLAYWVQVRAPTSPSAPAAKAGEAPAPAGQPPARSSGTTPAQPEQPAGKAPSPAANPAGPDTARPAAPSPKP